MKYQIKLRLTTVHYMSVDAAPGKTWEQIKEQALDEIDAPWDELADAEILACNPQPEKI